MNNAIEQIAMDNGIAIDEVNTIFTGFSALLASRIPELTQVIEDVLADEEAGKLKEHINKMVILLQEKNENVFKTWSMPEQTYIFRRSGNGPLF
jgi:hypothetical protein